MNLETTLIETLNRLIIVDIHNEIEFYRKEDIKRRLMTKYSCINEIRFGKETIQWTFKGSKTKYGTTVR